MNAPGILVLAELFDSLPLGIVLLDPTGHVVVYNRAEELLARRKREDVLGRHFFTEVAPCMNVRQLGGEFAEKIGRSKLDVNVEFSFPFPFMEEPRDVRVRMSSFEVDGQAHGFLVVEDVSVQRSIDRMKEMLQSLLVHDLKNPLAAVLGNLGYLQAVPGIRDTQDTMEAVTESIEAASRLQAMLLNLLDITRLETNSLPIRRSAVDLRELLRRCVDGSRAMARMRGVEISTNLPDVPVLASIDEGVIRRALDNLSENAIRHSKHVTLTARIEGTSAILEVIDDGPGVPAAIRESIFEKYAQASVNEAERELHNRGLGLTFVRLAARAHGGDVAVTCPAGGGSRFRIVLSLVDRANALADVESSTRGLS